MENDGTRVCITRKCGKLLTGQQRKFYSRTCKITQRRHQVKQLAVAYKGGCCQICGYSRCLLALDFHHRDPNSKDFNVSRIKSWERVKVELDKCDILCSNYHRELHDKE